MATIDLGHAGTLVTACPAAEDYRNIPHAKQFLQTHASLDPAAGAWVVSVADFPGFVSTAGEAGHTLRPNKTLAAFLRGQALDLRACADFMASNGSSPLFPFQVEGVEFLWRGRERLLLDEMGLGKTVQILHAIDRGGPVIVVCPATLKRNWAHECARWRVDLEPVVCSGRDSFRWPKPGQCVIVNYDILPEDPDYFGTCAPGTVLVADEAQAVKSYKAARTRNFRKLSRRVRKRDGYVWLATGTPVQNRPKELWGLLQALELGRRLYGDYNRFVKLFGGTEDGLGQIDWDPTAVHPNAMDPVRAYALRRIRADVMPQLPSKMRRAVEVPLTSKELRAALDHRLSLQDDWESYISRAMDNGYDDFAGERKQLASWKIPAMLGLLAEYRDAEEPVVVFSAHRAPIEALRELEGFRVIMGGVDAADRDAAVQAFQAGELRGIGCTIAAGGTGLTLTRAAHAIFVDRDWVPAQNLQAEDRLVRIGQTRGVLITDLVCDHPIDQRVHYIIQEKMAYHEQTTAKLDAGPYIPARSRDRYAVAAHLEELADAIDAADV